MRLYRGGPQGAEVPRCGRIVGFGEGRVGWLEQRHDLGRAGEMRVEVRLGCSSCRLVCGRVQRSRYAGKASHAEAATLQLTVVAGH